MKEVGFEPTLPCTSRTSKSMMNQNIFLIRVRSKYIDCIILF